MDRIVVGVDESGGAAEALKWSVREGHLHGAQVTAVMAWGFLDQHRPAAEGPFDPSYDEEDALGALRGFIAAAVGEEAATVQALPVCDLPARALLEAGATADLLVVGARGLGGFRGLLLGSVSQRCLRHTTTPICVVRQDGEGESRQDPRIVVGVDGSETAARALSWAVTEATARKAALHVIHAWEPAFAGYYPGSSAMFDTATFEVASTRLIDEALSAHELAGVPSVQRSSICGGATQAVLDAADAADLLVLGSRGVGGLKGTLLGSVTLQAAHHAPCPVVVVPPAR